jgi:hypothetical protein
MGRTQESGSTLLLIGKISGVLSVTDRWLILRDAVKPMVWGGNSEISAVTSLVLRLRKKVNAVTLAVGSIESRYREGYYLLPPKTEPEMRGNL